MSDNIDRNNFCPCCLKLNANIMWGIISPFLAQRAILTPPFPVKILSCLECGFRWSVRGLSTEEVRRLYDGYRGEAYFSERNSLEPWYTRSCNHGLGSEHIMANRRKDLLELLISCSVSADDIGYVIDHGGDRGQMLKEFKNAQKFVFDLSGVEPDAGVERLHALEDGIASADLVLNCHVLEHMPDPRQGLMESIALVRQGGFIYVEVPNEIWKGPFQPPFQKKWLEILCTHPSILKWADFFCTATRIKTGWIPPLGFVAIREHLNYFTLTSLSLMMSACRLRVLICKKSSTGNLTALGQKLE
ncbi:MAG: class I SAM-dependent methyltransferase [Methylomicrobium sp.]